MDRLWAPWRHSYVAANKPEKNSSGCFFCAGIRASTDKDSFLVARLTHHCIYLNKFPYNNGHLLVAPTSHKADFSQLTNTELLSSSLAIQHVIPVLNLIMQPDGFNIGMNHGAAAGAGVPSHLHWHIVPRWNGDTNFMPILTNTKVIVQSLDSLYDLLAQAFRDTPFPSEC